MSIPLNMKREDLLAKLEALRPAAAKADADALAKHKAEEREYLKRWKAAVRKGVAEALKWDYETAKKRRFEVDIRVPVTDADHEDRKGYRNSLTSPTCPPSRVNRLERCIALIERSTQARFRIQDSGMYRAVYRELTADVPMPEGLC